MWPPPSNCIPPQCLHRSWSLCRNARTPLSAQLIPTLYFISKVMSSGAFPNTAPRTTLDFTPKNYTCMMIAYCLPSPLGCKLPEGIDRSAFAHCHRPIPDTGRHPTRTVWSDGLQIVLLFLRGWNTAPHNPPSLADVYGASTAGQALDQSPGASGGIRH